MQDELKYSVYIHETPNGKRYVGATTDVTSRFKKGLYSYNHSFYNDIELYGWDNIKHTVVESDLSCDEACKLEQELIKKYNTTNPEYGYNVDKGGRLKYKKKNSPPVWSKRVQKRMIDMGISKKDLARALHCNYTQIINVLSGIVINEVLEKEICNYFNMEV